MEQHSGELVYASNSSTLEAEAPKLQIRSQPGLYSQTLSQKKDKQPAKEATGM